MSILFLDNSASATALDIAIDAIQRTLEFVVFYSVNQVSQSS
jgi:hypothetical protein